MMRSETKGTNAKIIKLSVCPSKPIDRPKIITREKFLFYFCKTFNKNYVQNCMVIKKNT